MMVKNVVHRLGKQVRVFVLKLIFTVKRQLEVCKQKVKCCLSGLKQKIKSSWSNFEKNSDNDWLNFKQNIKNGLVSVKQNFSEKINHDELLAKVNHTELWEKIKQGNPMVIMLVSLFIFFGCIFGYIFIKSYTMNKFLRENSEPAIAVSTIKAEKQDWQPKFKASGSFRAVQGVDVTTELAGLVRCIDFTPGAVVKTGDVLVKLEDAEEMAQLQSLQALADLAKITFERNKLQFEIKAISKEALDTDEANLKNRIALVAQQAAVLAKKTIVAPFNGRLGISFINLGQYINAGDKVVTLQSLDPIYFDFYVPQQVVHQMAVDQIVEITSDAFPDKPILGKITTIEPKADPETRNVLVQATIPNPDNRLLAGMFGQVEVNLGKTTQYLTLPQTAISFNPYGELVYLLNKTGQNKAGKPILTVKQSFVTVGLSRGDQIAVLTGIKEGDIVVTSGQNKLRNGSPVFINNSVQPLNEEKPNLVNE